MKKINTISILIVGLLLSNSCKEKYNPEVSDQDRNLLIVEGVINTGADSTIIKLSRTSLVDAVSTQNPEAGAVVNVESEANEIFALKETRKGVYAVGPLNLLNTKKYRLTIKTSKGANYRSDFVEVKISPPIDNVNWKIKENGIDLSVNTHDASNQTKYYRWEYVETWAFYSRYLSISIFDPASNRVRSRRKPDEEAFKCYGNYASSSIYLGSSAKLNTDVIFEAPLYSIESTSEKLTERYSILVKQYALTQEAYNFWSQLKKTTEGLGTIFDPQPSEIQSNIHNVDDPKEPVIGYMSAGKVEQKRISITKDQLPSSPTWQVKYPFDCPFPPDMIYNDEIIPRFLGSEKSYVPIEPIYNAIGSIIGYTAASVSCADCTTRGSNKKPQFWP